MELLECTLDLYPHVLQGISCPIHVLSLDFELLFLVFTVLGCKKHFLLEYLYGCQMNRLTHMRLALLLLVGSGCDCLHRLIHSV